MRNFILRRLLLTVPVLIGITLFTFTLIRLQPGGPFDTTSGGNPMPENVRAALERRYGLDRSLPEQFGLYLLQIVRGDFGPMLRQPFLTVNDIIAYSLPITLQLGAMSLAFGIALGAPLGILAATRHARLQDHLATFLAVFGVSIPVLALAPAFVIVFGLRLGWFPIAFWGADPPFFLGLLPAPTLSFLRHAVLPVVALGIGVAAAVARLTRASMLEQLTREYVKTARAKGLVERLVVGRHVLKNALIPVVTYLGPLLVSLMPASIVIETIFAINGLGRNLILSVLQREYFLLSSGTLVFAAILVAGNLLADVATAWLDPRVSYDRSG